MDKLKTITSILLIISLAIPLSGSFIIIQIQKQLLKNEVKERILSGIDRNELVILRFTITDTEKRLNWEDDREFEYNGEMYDVVDTKSEGDTITYWCWRDRDETKLNNRISDLAARDEEQNPINKEYFKRITSLLLSLYSPPTFDVEKYDNIQFAGLFTDNSFYCSPIIPPPIPPP